MGGLARSFLNLPKKPSPAFATPAAAQADADAVPPVGRKLPFGSDESLDKPVDTDAAETLVENS